MVSRNQPAFSRDWVDLNIMTSFIGSHAIIQGIWLNIQEWKTLLCLWGKIQTSIADAEKYLT